MTSGQQVVLANGASAANIFWQFGSSATIGTTAVIHGNILAAVSISLLTGSTLDGRALAQSGAVTVDTGGGNSVALPVATVSSSPAVIFPAGTVNNSTGTVNDASYMTPAVAGSIAAVFGSNLSVGTSSPIVSTPLPTMLAQSTYLIGGQAVPMYMAAPGQANVQIPWALAGQTQAAITDTLQELFPTHRL
jgi:Ice-binding-like